MDFENSKIFQNWLTLKLNDPADTINQLFKATLFDV